MRLNSDSYFESLSRDEAASRLVLFNEQYSETANLNELKEKLKKFERTRNLQIWHEGSAIQNHGHILFCVNLLYDKAVFYTSAEYFEMTKKHINVQRVVEAPELYIIAQCGSNDEQLAYVDTRIEDLIDLNKSIKQSKIKELYQGNKHSDQVFLMGMAQL